MTPCIEMSRATVRRRWIAEFGPLDRKQCLCHHCDNPRCVNFEHIFVGTQRDNIHDAMAKGRLSPPPDVTGIKRSRETRRKMSEAVKRRWQEGGKAAFGK